MVRMGDGIAKVIWGMQTLLYRKPSASNENFGLLDANREGVLERALGLGYLQCLRLG
jgi:hypothetical protein